MSDDNEEEEVTVGRITKCNDGSGGDLSRIDVDDDYDTETMQFMDLELKSNTKGAITPSPNVSNG